MRPKPQPGILEIKPYVAGRAHAVGGNAVTKLSANENPYGPSPKAVLAVREVVERMNIYPPEDHTPLQEAIGEIHDLDPTRIVCGAGSDELISLLCQAYAGPGLEVLSCAHGFAMYPISARAAGAASVQAPETARTADVDALLAAVTEKTAIVFIANPNNPTGTMLPEVEVRRLADGLPDHVLLVLDGAYAEYVEGFDGGAALVAERDNVVMTRTFSKIYGLGGLRVGWCYAPEEVVAVLHRMRGPFNVSALGLAGAMAAVRDTHYVADCLAANTRWRDWMIAQLNALGVPTDPAFANFVLPYFGSVDRAAAADAVLSAEGVVVRRVDSYGLPGFLRITVGDELACRRVLSILETFVAEPV